jgi:hypothetical protein
MELATGEISFDGEMPFPENNIVLYREIYIIEQWLRRITYAVMIAKHGNSWLDIISPKLRKRLKSRLAGLQGRAHLDCENSNNVIWLSNVGELRELLTVKSILPVVKVLSGYKRKFISSKIDELREIRNVIGHNRAVTLQTLTIWRGISTSLKHGIETFKSKLLYPAPDNIIHLGDSDNIVAKFFNLKTRNNDWSKFQPLFCESEYFYSLTHLPVEPFGRYVRISKILDTYHSLEHVILATLINKMGDEFTVTWPKTASVDKHHSIINTFLKSAESVWTSTDYASQSPKFICDPKIWFYENQIPIQE